MSGKYLRPDVRIDPLVNGWHAWSHLIQPATAALNLAHAQLPLLESFVRAPEVHATALRNPAMHGGRFVDLPAARRDDVGQLLERTRRRARPLLELATSIKALQQTLDENGDGRSLESLYATIPAGLKGLVELTYDLSHRPGVRYIEPLLYQSSYYDPASQSLALSLGADERPLIFSTPRLAGAAALDLALPFAHSALDRLFAARVVAQSPAQLADALMLAGDDAVRLSALLTDEPQATRPVHDGDSVRVRYLGHACLLIECRGLSLLVDPLIGSAGGDDDRFTWRDLPAHIDYVVITHGHADHLVLETLLQLRHRVGEVIVPASSGGQLQDPSLRLLLQQLGFRRVRALGELESIGLPHGSLTGVSFLGEHADLHIVAKLAYLISLGGKSILCAADSNNVQPELYARLHRWCGDIDILFIGMECVGAPLSWLYGPLLARPIARAADRGRTLSASGAAAALALVEALGVQQVYVYAMGQEPWVAHLTGLRHAADSPQLREVEALVRACAARGLGVEPLYGKKDWQL